MRKRKSKKTVFLILTGLVVIYLALTAGYLVGRSEKPASTDNQSTPNASGEPLKVMSPSLNVSDIDIYQLWIGTNNERAKAGLDPLSLNPKLDASAAAKCADMVQKNYWSHEDPNGTSPWHFITEAGVPYIHLAENLATGYDTAAATVSGWMASQEHKVNILDSKFTDVGFGACKSDAFVGHNNLPSLIVVQHFAQL